VQEERPPKILSFFDTRSSCHGPDDSDDVSGGESSKTVLYSFCIRCIPRIPSVSLSLLSFLLSFCLFVDGRSIVARGCFSADTVFFPQQIRKRVTT
jgi:hypothetical protein